jgi:archaellum component FlaF (FlaF/FlaG flagellin family)
MTLEKQITVDLIEVIENGSVQVRTKTAILEDGKLISSQFHRHVVVPGQDYSQEDAKVQAICASIHTTEVIASYQAAQEAARLTAQG